MNTHFAYQARREAFVRWLADTSATSEEYFSRIRAADAEAGGLGCAVTEVAK